MGGWVVERLLNIFIIDGPKQVHPDLEDLAILLIYTHQETSVNSLLNRDLVVCLCVLIFVENPWSRIAVASLPTKIHELMLGKQNHRCASIWPLGKHMGVVCLHRAINGKTCFLDIGASSNPGGLLFKTTFLVVNRVVAASPGDVSLEVMKHESWDRES